MCFWRNKNKKTNSLIYSVLLHVCSQQMDLNLILFKLAWPRGYKTFFMLNSTEHEIFPAHKC